MSDRVLLNLFLTPYGYHEASWVVSPVAEPGRLGLPRPANVHRR